MKHLAPYLPYDLKCYIMRERITERLEGLEYGYDENRTPMALFQEFGQWELTKFKPLLYPISRLRESISLNHHNEGQEFVPRKMLVAKWIVRNGKHHENANSIADYKVGQFTSAAEVKKGYDSLPHWVFQDLIKWHFDVFGLINKGLAIEKGGSYA